MLGLKIFVCGMLICAIVVAAGGIVFDMLTKLSTCYYENQFETGELIIKHVWTENDNYFFSDTNGTIYKLDNYKGAINYDELPIVRFEKLHADDVYRCVYTEGKHYRLSVSEINIEAEKGTKLIKNELHKTNIGNATTSHKGMHHRDRFSSVCFFPV